MVYGTISVQPAANQIPGFKDYFLSLTVENNARNPWFYELWENEFECRYDGYPATPFNQHYNRVCTGAEKFPANYTFEKQLQFVSDAVLVFAYALKDYLLEKCPSGDAKCIKEQYPKSVSSVTRINGTRLKEVMQNVEFKGKFPF